MTKRLVLILISALISGLMATASFAVEPINRSKLTRVAIEGYDPVAYFTDGKPVEGQKEFEHEWNGARWLFATAAHRTMFVKEPEKYAPQYGGYCAYGVSENYAVGIDPEAWKIVGGRLYLNYNKKVQTMWVSEEAVRIRRADENWPKLLEKK